MSTTEPLSAYRSMKEIMRRPRLELSESTLDFSNANPGKKNCKSCWGRGFQDRLTHEGNSIYRVNCWCVNVEK